VVQRLMSLTCDHVWWSLLRPSSRQLCEPQWPSMGQ